jgi:alanine dehydrogenase
LDELFEGRVRIRFSTIGAVEEEVFGADVVIGAVLVLGATTRRLVRRDVLSSMRGGSVIVHVAIDQGGCFETSHVTTHAEPTYEIDGVIHYYCVANMPGAVPLTSTQALNSATLPFGLALAGKGFAAVTENPHLRAGLNVYRGRLTYKAVAESLGLPFSPIEKAAA